MYANLGHLTTSTYLIVNQLNNLIINKMWNVCPHVKSVISCYIKKTVFTIVVQQACEINQFKTRFENA